MGGHAAAVLLPELLDHNQIDELKLWIGRHGTNYRDTANQDIVAG